MKKELLEGLSEEQIAKIRECKNTEEVLAIAKKEGVELTDEQLSAVSGGSACEEVNCPRCGSSDTEMIDETFYSNPVYKCHGCGCQWTDRSKEVR